MNSNRKDNNEAQEEKCMNKDGNTTCLHAEKVDRPAFAPKLEQQPRREHHEQDHRTPICHLTLLSLSLSLSFTAK